jgi:signal transduction histidine kinase
MSGPDTRGAAARQARLEERQRIADELHEEVAQILFAAQMTLDAALELPDLDSDAAAAVDRARALVIVADQALRSAIHQMSRPRRGTLLPELESIVSQVGQDFGLPIRLDIEPVAAEACTKLGRPVRDALLTVVREALVNAAKHAGPCQVSVRLAISGRRRLLVSVSDDGVGIGRGGQGYGLACLRRVVRAQGGLLRIRPSPSAGAEVLATFPQ